MEGDEVAGVVLGVHVVLFGKGEDLISVGLAAHVSEHPLAGEFVVPPAIEDEGHALAVAEALTLGRVPHDGVGERCVLGSAEFDGLLAELADQGLEVCDESLGAHTATPHAARNRFESNRGLVWRSVPHQSRAASRRATGLVMRAMVWAMSLKCLRVMLTPVGFGPAGPGYCHRLRGHQGASITPRPIVPPPLGGCSSP